jgi:hypothetical protein
MSTVDLLVLKKLHMYNTSLLFSYRINYMSNTYSSCIPLGAIHTAWVRLVAMQFKGESSWPNIDSTANSLNLIDCLLKIEFLSIPPKICDEWFRSNHHQIASWLPALVPKRGHGVVWWRKNTKNCLSNAFQQPKKKRGTFKDSLNLTTDLPRQTLVCVIESASFAVDPNDLWMTR